MRLRALVPFGFGITALVAALAVWSGGLFALTRNSTIADNSRVRCRWTSNSSWPWTCPTPWIPKNSEIQRQGYMRR